MKVRELVDLLNRLPQDHEVQFLSADGYEDAIEPEFDVQDGTVTFLPYTARIEIAAARKRLGTAANTFPPRQN